MALNFTPATAADAIEHGHGLASITGYIVRRTFPASPERAHEDAARFNGSGAYAAAMELVREIRAEAGDHYAVADPVYSCGCRGLA